MHSEDKLLTGSVLMVLAVASMIFAGSRIASRSSSAASLALSTLPKNTTRAQVVGSVYAAESSRSSYVLVEFGDYECPPCRVMHEALRAFAATHRDKVSVIFRHMPLLQIHPTAFDTALYAEAARDQGKFWQMHDLLYDNQEKFAPKDLKRYAQQLNLDMAQVHQSIETTARARVRADMDASLQLDLEGTPTLILCEPNGRVHSVGLDEAKDIIH